MAWLEQTRDLVLNWIANGYLNWSWWQILLITLLLTHITIASVTIVLHRCQAHRALELHVTLKRGEPDNDVKRLSLWQW